MQVRWSGQSAFALAAGTGSVFVDPFDTNDVAPDGGRIIVVPAPPT